MILIGIRFHFGTHDHTSRPLEYFVSINYTCCIISIGKSISRIQSLHRDCIEDRIWSFSCRSNAAAQSCSWTPTLNTYDNVLDYNCSHDGFITGIYSWHHNHYEDRR